MRRRILNSILLFGLVLLILMVALTKRESEQKKDIKQFTVFYDVQGDEIDEDNEIKKKIAEITGAECEEIWLGSQTKDDAINSYIASGEYTDFIVGGLELYQVGALLPIDLYWDDYPNIKQYMSEEEWNRLRLDDGHIYWIPQFGVVNGKDIETVHEFEAFWIQTRVLKWAGYPEVRTLDEYFELIGNYYEANPLMDNQTPNIPFTILCDDWRYFCLENPPQFLDGYPNDGSCMVDPVNLKVLDYNFTNTAKTYFKT
ncbi:MAG: sugar ABC transporter substrate-binding protein, partial [Clostridiales bacterium]|nr:sugar ABC transporter substrate-binding protein [Clostridiales bacterium]